MADVEQAAEKAPDAQGVTQSIIEDQSFESSMDGGRKEVANSQGCNDTIPKHVSDGRSIDSDHQSHETPDETDGQDAENQFDEDEDEMDQEETDVETDGESDIEDQMQHPPAAEAPAPLENKSMINKRMRFLVARPNPGISLICRRSGCAKAIQRRHHPRKAIAGFAIAHASTHCASPLYSCMGCASVNKQYSTGDRSHIRRHVKRLHNITDPCSGEHFAENWSDELYRVINQCYDDEMGIEDRETETGDSSVVSSSNGDDASGGSFGEALDPEQSAIESDDRPASGEAGAIADADDDVVRLRAELQAALDQVREAQSTKTELACSQEDRDHLRVQLETLKIENSRLDNALTESKDQVCDDLAMTKTELARSQEDRDHLRVELEALKIENSLLDEALKKSKAKREEAEAGRLKAEAERDESNEQLRDRKAKSFEERRRLEEELDEEKAKNKSAQVQIEQLTTESLKDHVTLLHCAQYLETQKGDVQGATAKALAKK